jgi:hypothetical protein
MLNCVKGYGVDLTWIASKIAYSEMFASSVSADF